MVSITMHNHGHHCDPARILKDAGLKRTARRIAILTELIDRARPATVSELHRAVRRQQEMDLATVYRLLNAMTEAGVVREAMVAGAERRFEIACGHNPPHAHFTCDDCGRVFCLEPFPVSDAMTMAGASEKFHARELSITMQGTCADCHTPED